MEGIEGTEVIAKRSLCCPLLSNLNHAVSHLSFAETVEWCVTMSERGKP